MGLKALLSAAAFALSVAFPAAAATLVHSYEFDVAGVVDSTGSINGSLFGDAFVSGGWLHLDGAGDYAELSGKIIPAGIASFSVEIRAQEVQRSSTFMELISQGFSQSAPYGFYLGHDPSGNIRVSDRYSATTVPFPTDLAPHTYLLTSSGASGTRLFIDGTLVFSQAGPIDTVATGANTRFGRQFDCCGEFFNGKIDYVRVYDGVKDPSSITPVPVPTSLPLLAGGVIAIAAFRRKAQRS